MRFLSGPNAPTAAALPGSGSAGDILAYNNSLYCYLNGGWVALNNNTTAIADVSGLTTALAGKEPSITSGSTTQYWRGDKSWQTLDKTAVGLANVDNTSDVNKPVSTATQTALNLKADLAAAAFTGAVSFSNSSATFNSGLTWTGTIQNANATSAMTLGGAPQIQVGPTSGSNLAFDRFGVQARNNGATATLNLNLLGGQTSVGGTLVVTSTIGASNFSGASSGTNTGDQTITLTGDVTGSGTGSFAATIGANKVTFAKLVAATQTAFVGATAVGNFGEITPSAATALLTNFSYSAGGAGTKGLVPATAVGDNTKFLRGDSTFAQIDVSGSNITGTLAATNFPALSGDITTTAGSLVTAIGANKVTLAQMAQVATATFLGRSTAGTGNVQALTATQATALLNTFGTTTNGLVPAPTAVAGKVLSDSGAWLAVAPAVSNWIPVTATGTGSSQNITLPESGLTVNDVMVLVEGIVQNTVDYSITGTTLAITAPNTSDILVRKLNASIGAVVQEAADVDVWTGTDTTKMITPRRSVSSSVEQTVTYAATVTLDGTTGFNFGITLTGNLTLANPTNFKSGQSGFIFLTQDATGSRTLTVGTNWKFIGGSTTLSTSANAVDVISYYVRANGTITCSIGKAFS